MSWHRVNAVGGVWIILDELHRNVATVVGDDMATLIAAAPDLRDGAEQAIELLRRQEVEEAIALLSSVTFRARRG